MVHDPGHRFRITMSDGQAQQERDEAESSGVDVTLIEEMLRLSPAERLRQNDRVAAMAVKLRAGFDARRAKWLSRET
jgi:hypothetical protein